MNPTRTAVGVIVLDKEKVLLHKRKGTSHADDTWALAGGWVEDGETTQQACIRETKEEYGIDPTNVEIFCSFEEHSYELHRMNIGAVVTSWIGTPQIMEPNKCIELKWFELNDLPDNIFIPSAKVIELYKNNR